MEVVKGSRLTVGDIRGALRLANELHEMDASDPAARRRHLAKGLCGLIGAEIGVVALRRVGGRFRLATTRPAGGLRGRGSSAPSALSHGWGTTDEIARAPAGISLREHGERHFANDPEPHPLVPPVLRLASRRPNQLVTCLRSEVMDDVAWHRSPDVTRLRLELGIDECIVSMFPMAGGSQTAWVFLYRSAGRGGKPSAAGPFDARQCELLHAVHSEMDWLYERPRGVPIYRDLRPVESSPSLTERQRETLDHLLAGQSEKQAAANMGLSPHTVHIHIKSLYRAYRVNTRQELLAKFIGQDRR